MGGSIEYPGGGLGEEHMVDEFEVETFRVASAKILRDEPLKPRLEG